MMEWLTALTSENTAQILKFLGLFILFMAVIYVVYLLIKRMSGGTYVARAHAHGPRLSVSDAAAVDSQRRLVLVRRDNVEHLILIGGPTDIVIEQNIRINEESNASNAGTASASSQIHQAQPVYAPNAKDETPYYSDRAATQLDADFTDFLTQDAPVDLYDASVAVTSREPQFDTQMRSVQSTASEQQQSTHILQTHAQQVAAAARQQASLAPRPPVSRQAEPAEAAPKLHPAYPLGQVARGVIAATSGLAAANNAAQHEMIAAAMRDKPNSTARPAPLQPTTALPSLATPQAIQSSLSATPQSATLQTAKPATTTGSAASLGTVRPGEQVRSPAQPAQASQPAQILAAQRANAQAQSQAQSQAQATALAQQAEKRDAALREQVKREPNFTAGPAAASSGSNIGTTVQRSVSVTQTVTQVTTDMDTNDFTLDLETAVSEALAADNDRSFEDMLSSEMDLQFNEPATPEQSQGSGILDIPARK